MRLLLRLGSVIMSRRIEGERFGQHVGGPRSSTDGSFVQSAKCHRLLSLRNRFRGAILKDGDAGRTIGAKGTYPAD